MGAAAEPFSDLPIALSFLKFICLPLGAVL